MLGNPFQRFLDNEINYLFNALRPLVDRQLTLRTTATLQHLLDKRGDFFPVSNRF